MLVLATPGAAAAAASSDELNNVYNLRMFTAAETDDDQRLETDFVVGIGVIPPMMPRPM